MISEQAALVLEENVKRSTDLGSTGEGVFSRELRRMREFEKEVCPEEMKDAVNYIKENGWKVAELFSRFGKREWRFPIRDLEIYAALLNKFGRTKKDSSLSLSEDDKRYRFDITLPITECRPYERRKCYLKKDRLIELGDKIRGFSRIYADHREEETLSRSTTRLRITGVPKDYRYYLDLGDISIEEIDPIGERRFTYIFGIPPASFAEIKKTLVKINRLPEEGKEVKTGLFEGYTPHYKLERRDFGKLESRPRAADLWYEEALSAKEEGLFSEVQCYELLGELVRVHIDPVIIGFDAFGNKYPIVYWAGDKGLGKIGND